MLAVTLLLLLQAVPATPATSAAAPPSTEALALGRELAASGTLASLLPLIAEQETADTIAELKLAPADQPAFRATAQETLVAGRARLFDAMGREYATRLSLADLRALVTFAKSDAARARRAIEPAVIAGTMQGVGQLDFKGDTRKAWCAKSPASCASK